jgi:hypothetical protein
MMGDLIKMLDFGTKRNAKGTVGGQTDLSLMGRVQGLQMTSD